MELFVLFNCFAELLFDLVQVAVVVEDIADLPASEQLISNYSQHVFNVGLVIEVVADQSASLGSGLESKEILGIFLALDHVHDTLLVQHKLNAERTQVAIVDKLQV